MHLEVNQRLQEVASHKRDKFKPQEIDLALNKAMYRLLEAAVLKKFEDTQINLSHVGALIHKNRIGEVIKPASNDKLYEEDFLSIYTVLPPDFYWTTNVRAEVVTDPLECDTAPELATNTLGEYIAIVAFPALGTAPYFANTSVSSSTLGTLYTNATIAAGFASANSKYFVVNNIIETMYRANPNIVAYWERYRDVYYPNSFIFVGKVDIGTMTVTSNAQTTVVVRTLNSYTGYNRALIPDLDSYTKNTVPCEILESDIIYNALKHNTYYAAGSDQPNVVQTQDYLIAYREESFLITRLMYDYIRKPRTISLVLSQDCELAPTTHPKVIDLAVEILRLDTKDQAAATTTQDIELRTN